MELHRNLKPWPPGVSSNPNGRPVGSRTAFSHGFLKDLAEVWQEHGRDTMLHTAKTQPATFFEAPNECAIYLLRSLLRQTSCWVSAITGGTGPKITGHSISREQSRCVNLLANGAGTLPIERDPRRSNRARCP